MKKTKIKRPPRTLLFPAVKPVRQDHLGDVKSNMCFWTNRRKTHPDSPPAYRDCIFRCRPEGLKGTVHLVLVVDESSCVNE